ncbi:MAG: DUF481 domain-containing protein [Campylobacterota bacterium]|nr:DUF481 domain-containing protein [Campylobacterota bacterium]
MLSYNKILLSGLVFSSLVIAEDINFDESNKLVTHTEFGYISTEGNTKTKVYALESKIKKGFDKNLFTLIFDAQFAEDQKVETKNKYFIELIYDYELTDKIAFNYLVGYKDDKFSGYDYQLYTGPGVAYKALTLQKHNLAMDTNILYSKDNFDDIDYDASGNIIAYPNPNNTPISTSILGLTDNYTSFRIKANYEWQVLEDLKFTQETSYRTEFEDLDNYFVFLKTAFSSKINSIFSAGVSYKVDYVNLEAEGKEATDRTLTATLSIEY